jgi:hypothetical protein
MRSGGGVDAKANLLAQLVRVIEKTARMCEHPSEADLLGLGLSKGQAERVFQCLRDLRSDETLFLFLRSTAAMTVENLLVLLDGIDGDSPAPARLKSHDGGDVGADLHSDFVRYLCERKIYC